MNSRLKTGLTRVWIVFGVAWFLFMAERAREDLFEMCDVLAFDCFSPQAWIEGNRRSTENLPEGLAVLGPSTLVVLQPKHPIEHMPGWEFRAGYFGGYLVWALAPFGLLLLWWVFEWIVAGFQKSPQRT